MRCYKVEILNIKTNKDNRVNLESMDTGGSWLETTAKSWVRFLQKTKKLDYRSGRYDYFIGQSDKGWHTLFRIRKNES